MGSQRRVKAEARSRYGGWLLAEPPHPPQTGSDGDRSGTATSWSTGRPGTATKAAGVRLPQCMWAHVRQMLPAGWRAAAPQPTTQKLCCCLPFLWESHQPRLLHLRWQKAVRVLTSQASSPSTTKALFPLLEVRQPRAKRLKWLSRRAIEVRTRTKALVFLSQHPVLYSKRRFGCSRLGSKDMFCWQHYMICLELFDSHTFKALVLFTKHCGVVEHGVMVELKAGKKHLHLLLHVNKSWFPILVKNKIRVSFTLAVLISDNLSSIYCDKKTSCQICHHFFHSAWRHPDIEGMVEENTQAPEDLIMSQEH